MHNTDMLLRSYFETQKPNALQNLKVGHIWFCLKVTVLFFFDIFLKM